jgi:hypothetical protein
MMFTEPYVALAFFAPVTVKTFENVTIVEDALEQYLSSIAAGCHDEFIRFKASAHRPSAGAVTLDSYRSYISNRIRPQYPTIATVLINLLAACPTEAAVERGFSFLKFIANDWRNRLEERNGRSTSRVAELSQDAERAHVRLPHTTPAAEHARSIHVALLAATLRGRWTGDTDFSDDPPTLDIIPL